MIKNKDDNFVSAVIYVYNCEDKIQDMLKNVNEILSEKFKTYEIICVNDASTDNSLSRIREFKKTLKYGMLSVINMSYYQGVEPAMNAGVDMAIGDFVYEFDNLITVGEKKIVLDIYDKCINGFDIVSASNEECKNKYSERFYKIFNKYSSMKYKIYTENFRILSRRAINRIQSMTRLIPYRKALYANCGLKICNIKYKCKENKVKKIDKEEYRNKIETATNSLILFTNIGYRFAFKMCITMAIIIIILSIYAISKLISGCTLSGWITTALLLSFIFGGLFVLITVAIKYMEVLVKIILKKYNYIIETVEKIS